MSVQGCCQLQGLLGFRPEMRRCVVDFSDLRFATPFGMILVSYQLNQFKAENEHAEFDFVNYGHLSYPAHVGFFRAFGIDFGKAPGEAAGNERYIPLTILDVEQIRAEARERFEVVQTYLEDTSRRLAQTLAQDSSNDVRAAMAFALTEMLRNVVEHSSAQNLAYCAQYWPNSGEVELAVLDSGIGIRRGLSRNPYWQLQSDSHALHLALLPGISGTAYAGACIDQYDHWANSGYGLYMTSGICRSVGSFLIASGNAAVLISGNNKTNPELAVDGTAIRMRLNVRDLPRLTEIQNRLRKEGELIERRLRGTVVSSNRASQIVREGPSAI